MRKSERQQFQNRPTGRSLKSVARSVLNKREPVAVLTNRHKLRHADFTPI
jgi:hypothetical protein